MIQISIYTERRKTVDWFVKPEHYPNGEQRITFPDTLIEAYKANKFATVTWYYNDDSELATVMFIIKHLEFIANNDPDYRVTLSIPYLPYARMDRIEKDTQCFTLNGFLDVLSNTAPFVSRIETYDLHTDRNKTKAKFPRYLVSYSLMAKLFVMLYGSLTDEQKQNIVLVFPDETAERRYIKEATINRFADYPTLTIAKKRDFDTGELIGFEVKDHDTIDLDNAVLIMIDDLCVRGGTFLGAYKAVEELADRQGQSLIGFCLLVTHFEEAGLTSPLLDHDKLIAVTFAETMGWMYRTPKPTYHNKMLPLPLIP